MTTLSVAAAGRQLPSLAVTLAYVEACGGDKAVWEARWRAVAAEIGEPAAAEADAVPPYRGLAAYEPDDAPWFFGRERLVSQLLESLSARRLLAVFGASGSGKSSVLRAGVAPQVAEGALGLGARWPVLIMTPGVDPLACLAEALAGGSPAATTDLAVELRQDPGALSVAVETALTGEPSRAELLLVVDQFEELFTLCADDTARRAFLAAVLQAVQAPESRLRVMLGVRADFYARCAQYPDLVAALQDAQTLVGPMSAAELREALVRPAERAGLRVEGALVSTVVAQLTDRPGALPLASHAMAQAWRRRQGTTITLAGYEAAGGVDGAIAQSAEGVYTTLGPRQRATLKRVVLRLVEIGDDAVVTRRRVTRAEFDSHDPDVPAVIDALVAARLVTVSRGTVEITHEALIAAWPRLRGWVEEDHASLRLHRMLTHAAAEWDSLGRDDVALYRGSRLTRAAEWLAEHPDAATAQEREFLQRGLAVEHQARVQRHRRQRTVVVALLAAVVLVSALAVATFVQASRAQQLQEKAQRQHEIALSRQLAAQSLNIDATQPVTARRLAVAASLTAPTDEARDSMTALLSQQRHRLVGHTSAVRGIAFRPDGKLLATASYDQTVRLWNPGTGQPVGAPLVGHTDEVWSVAFSPDGTLLATGGTDQTVRLWDPGAGRPVGGPLTGHSGAVLSVAFSPDGGLLATAGFDDTVRLWNPTTGRPVGRPLTGHSGAVLSVAFSPDGGLLATAGADDTVRVWNPRTGQPVGRPLTGHTDDVRGVAFSPDGKLLATGGTDQTVRFWDPGTGRPVGRPLIGHSGAVLSVAFSRDGKLLATAGFDDTVRLWNPGTGQPAGAPLIGHAGAVLSVGFSPDGRLLATGGTDQTARLWNPGTGQPAGGPLTGHTDDVRGVAFSPDGKSLATASTDRTIRLWNPGSGQPVGRPLTGHTDDVLSVTFSADGKLLATASTDQTVRLWDPGSGRPVGRPLTGHAGAVLSVAFSPDGRLLATASTDQTVRLWDPRTGRPVGGPLIGHTGAVRGVAFSPDGRLLATAGFDDTVRLWNPGTGRPAGRPLIGHTGAVLSVAFSPDGRLLATGGTDQTVRLWDPGAGQPIGRPLIGHTDDVRGVAFSPDGGLLATAGFDDTVRLWNPATGQPVGEPLTGHTDAVLSVTFSPDGRLLATAGFDDTVRLWNPRTGQPVAGPLTDGTAPPRGTAAFEDLLRTLCARYGLPTTEEWSAHAGQEPMLTACRDS